MASDEDAKKRWRSKAQNPQIPGLLVHNEWRGTYEEFEEAVELGDLLNFLRIDPNRRTAPPVAQSIPPVSSPGPASKSNVKLPPAPTLMATPAAPGQGARILKDEDPLAFLPQGTTVTDAEVDELLKELEKPLPRTTRRTYVPSSRARMAEPTAPSLLESSTRPSEISARYNPEERSTNSLVSEAAKAIGVEPKPRSYAPRMKLNKMSLDQIMADRRARMAQTEQSRKTDELFASLGLSDVVISDKEAYEFLEHGKVPSVKPKAIVQGSVSTPNESSEDAFVPTLDRIWASLPDSVQNGEREGPWSSTEPVEHMPALQLATASTLTKDEEPPPLPKWDVEGPWSHTVVKEERHAMSEEVDVPKLDKESPSVTSEGWDTEGPWSCKTAPPEEASNDDNEALDPSHAPKDTDDALPHDEKDDVQKEQERPPIESAEPSAPLAGERDTGSAVLAETETDTIPTTTTEAISAGTLTPPIPQETETTTAKEDESQAGDDASLLSFDQSVMPHSASTDTAACRVLPSLSHDEPSLLDDDEGRVEDPLWENHMQSKDNGPPPTNLLAPEPSSPHAEAEPETREKVDEAATPSSPLLDAPLPASLPAEPLIEEGQEEGAASPAMHESMTEAPHATTATPVLDRTEGVLDSARDAHIDNAEASVTDTQSSEVDELNEPESVPREKSIVPDDEADGATVLPPAEAVSARPDTSTTLLDKSEEVPSWREDSDDAAPDDTGPLPDDRTSGPVNLRTSDNLLSVQADSLAEDCAPVEADPPTSHDVPLADLASAEASPPTHDLASTNADKAVSEGFLPVESDKSATDVMPIKADGPRNDRTSEKANGSTEDELTSGKADGPTKDELTSGYRDKEKDASTMQTDLVGGVVPKDTPVHASQVPETETSTEPAMTEAQPETAEEPVSFWPVDTQTKASDEPKRLPTMTDTAEKELGSSFEGDKVLAATAEPGDTDADLSEALSTRDNVAVDATNSLTSPQANDVSTSPPMSPDVMPTAMAKALAMTSEEDDGIVNAAPTAAGAGTSVPSSNEVDGVNDTRTPTTPSSGPRAARRHTSLMDRLRSAQRRPSVADAIFDTPSSSQTSTPSSPAATTWSSMDADMDDMGDTTTIVHASPARGPTSQRALSDTSTSFHNPLLSALGVEKEEAVRPDAHASDVPVPSVRMSDTEGSEAESSSEPDSEDAVPDLWVPTSQASRRYEPSAARYATRSVAHSDRDVAWDSPEMGQVRPLSTPSTPKAERSDPLHTMTSTPRLSTTSSPRTKDAAPTTEPSSTAPPLPPRSLSTVTSSEKESQTSTPTKPTTSPARARSKSGLPNGQWGLPASLLERFGLGSTSSPPTTPPRSTSETPTDRIATPSSSGSPRRTSRPLPPTPTTSKARDTPSPRGQRPPPLPKRKETMQPPPLPTRSTAAATASRPTDEARVDAARRAVSSKPTKATTPNSSAPQDALSRSVSQPAKAGQHRRTLSDIMREADEMMHDWT